MHRLSELKRGQSAEVRTIHGEGDTVTRLYALGLLPGARIEHVNTAPLGDPVAYRIEGQKISMRRSDSAHVEIGEPHS